MNWSFSRLGFAMLLVCFLGLAALPRDSRIALTHAQADAQDGAPIIGQIGGETRAVLLRGDLAYVGIGPRFTVLDLSEPNAPAVIHRSQPLPNVIQAIVRQGDYAYVACGEACGLRVFDVSEPGQPRIIGAASTPGLALDLAVEDEVLVLADGVRGLHSNNFGLRVFDIGNPRRPQEIAVVEGIGARRVIM